MTDADQAFIDRNIEGAIAACRFARPAARTPSCADLRSEIAELRKQAAGAAKPLTTIEPEKPKKIPLWRRMLVAPPARG